MRFTAPASAIHAAPNPKYFGQARGVTWNNLLSNQFSGLNGILVPGTLRDSLVLLTLLLEQEMPASDGTSPLSFWSAPIQLHHRLSLRIGTDWLAGFLACIATAARAAREELAGLQRAKTAGATLARTTRSQLPRAVEYVLRSPVVTARGLA